MYLHTLSLANFRSYRQAEFEFSPELTFIIGPNTAGKTNILEAIVLLATGRSFSEHSGQHLIRNGKTHFHLEAVLEVNADVTREIGINAVYDSDNCSRVRKKFVVEGVGKKRDNFARNFQVVYFGPEEIRLILGSPSRRRSYLDSVLSALDPVYVKVSARYRKARLQRNNLLKLIQKGNSSGSDLLMWTERVVEVGNIITHKRSELVANLNKIFSRNHYGSLEDLTLAYTTNNLSLDRFRRVKRKEIEMGTTFLGPHRDDFKFVSAGAEQSELKKDLAAYGSRGEQRLAVTALKLAELELRSEVSGQRPILLLDDVFSELDPNNRERILEVIPKQQTIITTTNPEIVERYFESEPQVIRL